MKKNIILGLILLFCVGLLWASTGDESIALTFLHKPRLHNTVWDCIATSTHDADDTGDVTQAVTVNGIIQKVVLTIPNFSNGITGQVVIKDNEDRTIFDSGEQAKNATYAFSLHEPVTGEIDIVIGVSGASGGTADSNDMIVVLRGI